MVGLGSLSGGGVLIAGGGAACTDCFQDDAKPVGASLLAIPGINQISTLTPPQQATHHPCGEGACSRWAAKQPQDQPIRLVR